MKKITRLFATLFIAALIFTFKPAVNADASTVATGKAGDAVTWELDDQGLMTFSGTGNMYSYSASNLPEWYSYRSQIKALKFEDGVTCIGVYAFANCSNLKSADTGNGVTIICANAFYDCPSLESIYIGKNVCIIGSSVFQNCNALNKVEIGSLESWLEITFMSADCNPLYTAGHLYLDGNEVTDLVIPDDIQIIQEYAFAGCVGLESVDTGNSVKEIKIDAFDGCSNLKEITLGSALQTVSYSAFGRISSEAVFRLSDYSEFDPQYFIDNGFTYEICHELKKIEAVEPTCISTGHKEYYSCMSCDKIFADAEGKEETTLDDLTIVGDHVLTAIAGKAATCAKAGNNAYYVCSICGKAFKDANGAVKTTVAAETIAKTTNHKYVKKTVAAKIGVAGKTYQKCSVCGKVSNVKTIAALKPAATAIKTIKAGKKSFTVTWTKKSYTGYQVRYSLKSSMASAKTVTVTKAATVTKKVSSLKAKKKYYVQVRTYKTVNGKKVCSAWSAKKSVTTK